MELLLLKDIVVLFALSLAIVLVCHRFKVPSIVGFILSGIVAGPHGLKLVAGMHNVELLSQIGIILLLFTVGMELSLRKILDVKRYFLFGGFLQVALTCLGGFLVGQWLDKPVGESLFLGFLLSLSSTAIVLRVLQDRVETSSPHGRIAIGILIFQDILVIPLMLLVPVMAGSHQTADLHLGELFTKVLVLLVGAFLFASYLLPRVLDYIARTRSRELFIMAIITICFSVAWVASSWGLSLSIGAFLAGLIISETEYSHEAIGDILPFRDLFTSFFFVSIGMMLDVGFVLAQPLFVAMVTCAVLLFKFFTGAATALILGTPLRLAVLSAVALSQVGEFSFVLAKAGMAEQIGTEYNYQLFLAVSLFTMALSPLVMALGPRLAALALLLPLPHRLKSGQKSISELVEHPKSNHVIIVGFGLSGKNLAGACRRMGIAYTIIETNPDTVHKERKLDEPIHFGDASHESVLLHAHVKHAKALAVLINDPTAMHRVVHAARKLNPELYIISRTRYVQEVPSFIQHGADDVVPDEFGASVEIFTRVLRRYNVPAEEIDAYTVELSERLLRQ